MSVAPRAAGRLQDVSRAARRSRQPRPADRQDRGLRDRQEQVKQAEAAQEVSLATIRQREADLQLAQTNAERSRNLFERQLLPKQTLDDNEARYQSALAQLDLARAQNTQSKARLDELRINLATPIITSPVNGFVVEARRSTLAPSCRRTRRSSTSWTSHASGWSPTSSRRISRSSQTGDATRVEVDAFPGETFMGRIARVSPVLDPATRTAPIEIEIPNPTSG